MEYLIHKLRDLNIDIDVVDNNLKLNIPEGFNATEVIEEIKLHKEALISFINKSRQRTKFNPILKAPNKDHYVLSSVQKRLHFLYEFDPNSLAYNVPQFVRMEGTFDKDRLSQAFQKLVNRHEALRTSFHLVNEEAVQRVAEELPITFEYFEADEEEAKKIGKTFVRPFDLTHAPLMRVGVIKLDEGDHLLMVDMHHIITDGTSFGILNREFMALYHEEQLPPIPLHYKDYAEWQQSQEQQAIIAHQKEFWLNEFSDDITPLQLPQDYPRPAVKGIEGGYLSFHIDKEHARVLKSVADKEDATMFALILAIFNVLLHRLSNRKDIVVGTPIAGREHADLEEVVGMFVAVLPLRNFPDSKMTFREFLRQVRTKIPKYFDNQAYSYEELIEALKLPRDTSRNPLFDVMFSYQNFDVSDVDLEGLEMKDFDVGYSGALFDLTLIGRERGGRIQFSLNYSTELFKRSTIERFATYFQQIGMAVMKDMDVKLSKINILPEEEIDQLLGFGMPNLQQDDERPVFQWFEETVAKYPSNIALIGNGEDITFTKLNESVNQLAHYLIQSGIKKGDLIGINLERSPQMIISMLAILKVGGAYVSLDPEYPEDRILAILEDARLETVITVNEQFPVGKELHVIDLNGASSEIAAQSTDNPEVQVSLNDLAYVIYTSGSTGKPKGILIEHGSLQDYSLTFKNQFEITPESRTIQQSSLAFDTVVEEVYPTLLAGGALIILPEGGRNIDQMVAAIDEHQATILSTTPMVVGALNQHVSDLASLQILISGGDLLLPTQIDRLIKSHNIYNSYGPAESCVCITYHKINDIGNASVLGKPIRNRRVYILNEDLNQVPIGVPGELCVSGRGLARGYLNNESLTHQKFVDNPFAKGQRMYRTGDLVKWNHDGTIEFLGRSDQQLKIRGYRIETGEIEEKLTGHVAVQMSHVTAFDNHVEKFLVAYYTTTTKDKLDERVLRAYLSEILPVYMVPSIFIWIESFPTNTNGKIDQAALPDPELAMDALLVSPQNETEAWLVQSWSDLLNRPVDKLSVTASFFELGGHSIKATVAVNKMRKQFGVEVPLRDFFRFPDIRSLARYIEHAEKSTQIDIPKAPEQPHYVLSSAQRRLYFLQQFELQSIAYNIPQIVRLIGPLDVVKLKGAFQSLVNRHESFRTTFVMKADLPVQVIAEEIAFEVQVHQVTEAQATELVKAFVAPFDLAKGPLLRVELIAISETSHILMTDMHHIISDGVSMGILIDEFGKLYQGAELPELRLQYKDYAVWQQGDAGKLEEARKYWLSRYADIPDALELPIDHERPAMQQFVGDTIEFTINEKQTQALKTLAKEHDATMFMTLLATFNVFLSRLTNQQDIVVGTPEAGRPHEDLSRMVGMFANTLALRNYPSIDKTFAAFLKEVQASTLAAFDHQSFQYETLIEELKMARDTSRNPLLDVMFSYQTTEPGEEEDTELKIETYGEAALEETAKCDLSLFVVEHGEQLRVSLNYAVHLFDQSSIERFAVYFQNLVTAIVDNQEAVIAQIPILSTEEEQHLLQENHQDTKLDETVLDRFQAVVASHPENIAIQSTSESLTYGLVGHLSTLIALDIQHACEGFQYRRIALIMEPSGQLVAGMLASMKLGCSYIPMLAKTPNERLLHMLSDAAPDAILVDHIAKNQLEGLLDEQDTPVIYIGEDYPYHIDGSLPAPTAVHDPVYIIYTSGTTGKPKGVEVLHEGLTNMVAAYQDLFQVKEGSRLSQVASPAFDATCLEIWPALTCGATLVIADGELRADPEAMKRWLVAEKINVTFQPTPIAEYLLKEDWSPDNSLEVMTLGGDRLHHQPTKELPFEVYNLYGPTEDTVWTTWKQVEATVSTGRYSIGVPIRNKQVYVLNDAQKLQPIGVAGELTIDGIGLANGYLNNEALTTEKFIDHPYHQGKRLYRTGDLVRKLPNGEIEFLGRLDDQVKLRGFRIELADIEDHLLAYNQMQEAAVLLMEQGGEKRLVAFCVLQEELDRTALVSFLSNRIPDYMVPFQFVGLEALPKTANGKIDKKSLAGIEVNLEREFVAPEGEQELALVDLFAALLQLEAADISMSDNFFDLGGHSLLANVAVNKIRKAFGIEVLLREFFGFPDLRTLASFMASAAVITERDIPKAEEKPYYVLSSAQTRLYFLQQFDQESTAYNMPQIVRLTGPLQVDQLQKTFQELVNRHESFRTSFVLKADQPMQQIASSMAFEVPVYQANEEEVPNMVRNFIRPFDLQKDVLLRVTLIEISANQHVLMTDMHHIISDGVSMKLLIDEFTALYEGETLTPLKLQYKDYAEWQQTDKSRLAEAEAYWLDRYKDLPDVLTLPADHPRPAMQQFEGKSVRFKLDRQATQGLRELSRENGATLFMTLLSVFNVLLSRLSNQQDIVVGTPEAGRNHEDLSGIVGMFVNTLALRNFPAGKLSFAKFLRAVKQATLDAFDHQSYQYETLVETLNIPRDTSRNPLMDVMFTFHKEQVGEQSLSELQVEDYQGGASSMSAKFDLMLDATEEQDQLVLNFTYATHLFEPDTIERYAKYFSRIVTAVINDPAARLSKISLLSKEDAHQILTEFNTTPEAHSGRHVVELFNNSAKEFSSRMAIKHESGTLTYEEVATLSDGMAHLLQEKGIRKGDLVGVMLHRDPWLVVSILGVLKAGAAYVSIDPSYPKERTEQIAVDAQLMCFISTEDTYEAANIPTIKLDKETVSEIRQGNQPKRVTIGTHDLAYVIYTSGSTGKPKGVMVEHGSLFNLLSFMHGKYALGTTDTYLLKTTFTFDVSCTELFGWFFEGGALAILPTGEEGNPAAILAAIEDFGVTHMNFVPSVFHIFLDTLEQQGISAIANLKYLFLAGEALPISMITRFRELGTDTLLENLYGPTEATVYSTGTKTAHLGSNSLVPIGTPIDNVTAYVVDADLQLQPVGVPGELCVGGLAVTRGYLNNEALTEKYFVDNPYRAGEKMYRTGDLVRWSANRELIYLGRLDHQVKVRGYRIELGEIERQLMTAAQVSQCVVTTLGEGADKYLIAYYTSNESGIEDQLRQHLAGLLPKYMVPGVFVQLDQFPLSSSGKINRKALPDPGEISLGEYAAAANDTEEQMLAIWAEVLSLPAKKLSVTANFFELGGHSLKATIVVNKIRKVFGVEVSLREFFSIPSIRFLSNHVLVSERTVLKDIPKAPKSEHYVLSSSQSRLYFLQQFNQQSIAYNMPQIIRLNGSLDIDRIKEVFQSLVDRHESFRTRFTILEDEPIQQIQESLDFEVTLHQATASEVIPLVKTFVRPFDLETAPLLRVELIRVSATEHILMTDMHHIISDGESMRILMEEFTTLYEGGELPALTLQYKDYANWQQTEDAKLAEDRKYWLNRFEEVPDVMELPTDFDRPAIQQFTGDTLDVKLDAETTKALQDFAQQQGTTMFMTLLSVFNVLLSKLSNQQDIVIGTPTAGRNNEDLTQMVGMFVNTLALRNYPAAKYTFLDFLQAVKQSTLEAFDHQNFQYESLVEALNIPRDTSRNPLMDVMFNYENDEQAQMSEGAEMQFAAFEDGNSDVGAKFDLLLEAFDGKQLALRFTYATHLFTRATIDRYGQYLQRIIQYILTAPEQSLAEISFLSDQDQRVILNEFNQAPDMSAKISVLDVFEQTISKYPDQIAIKHASGNLSYKEVTEKSNGVAHLLQSKGIGKGSLVAVMLDRDPWMMISILGVLKAGAAYVPIDPDYPEERINAICEDAELTWMIARPGASAILGVEVIELDQRFMNAINENPQPVTLSIEEDDLAYVIYTSGSTGKPKGVMVAHGSLFNVINYLHREYGLHQGDTYLLKTTFTFDVSCTELFGWFFDGGALAILPQGEAGNPAIIVSTIKEFVVTHMNYVPSAFSIFLDVVEQLGANDIQSLKYLFLAGEALPISLVNRFRALGISAQLENLYGPTEATIYSTGTSTTHLSGNDRVTIGTPIANVISYVMDSQHQLQPVGVPGELCISGKAVTKGYLNNQALTDQYFVTDPFHEGLKMYRTGDLVRWSQDGKLIYMGRIDHQVKVRGYRIELGEVERQLMQLEQVDQGVATTFGEGADKYLVAYYTSSFDDIEAELRQGLAEALPGYMVPGVFVKLESLPLSSSGKVNRKALPNPSDISLGAYEAPANENEEQLLRLWSQVLRLPAEKISVTANFFELGGNSLRATVLVNKINKAMGYEVPLHELFRRKNIRSLATYLESANRVAVTEIPKAAEKPEYVLSSAQQRLYFLQQLDKDSVAYNMPQVFRMKGALDIEAIRSAFQELVNRHESFRTRFVMAQDQPVQQIEANLNFMVPLMEAAETELLDLVDDFVKPFDLSVGNLLRVKLVKVSAMDHLMMIDMHHIISDGVSMSLMSEEFMTLYNGNRLSQLDLQYKDYAEWQQGGSSKTKEARAYWLSRYSELPEVLELPLDFNRPSEQRFDGATFRIELSTEDTVTLRELTKESGGTMFMTMLAIYNVLLARLSNQQDVVVGTPESGRSHQDLSGIIGMFANTLALRNYPADDKTFVAFLKEVKESTLAAFDHAGYQYETLIDELNLARNASRNPMLDVMITYQNTEAFAVDIPRLQIESFETNTAFETAKCDLSLFVYESTDHLSLVFNYATHLFQRETVFRFAEYFKRIISAIRENKEVRLSQIDILPTHELKALLSTKFNAADRQEQTVLDLFDRQVALGPDCVAVLEQNQQVSYSELNAWSDQIAQHIFDTKGELTTKRVALLIAPSVDLVAGMIASYKIGCAYIPLAASTPKERLVHMLQDAAPDIVLVQDDFYGNWANTFRKVGITAITVGACKVANALTTRVEIAEASTPAYIIYTSGTTGLPKGVEVNHQGLYHMVQSHHALFQPSKETCMSQVASPAFDAAAFEIWPALAAGAQLCIAAEPTRKDPAAMKSWLIAQKIQWTFQPTPMAEYLLQEDWSMDCDLEIMTIAGDRLHYQPNQALPFEAYNLYGPTEDTIWTTYKKLSDANDQDHYSIGRPLANKQIYIVNGSNQLQPQGVVGELAIAGVGLANGYLNNEALTTDKFVLNPFESGHLMYKSGDLARILPNGEIEFMGRLDDQVKIRGFRIEVAEIEDALLKHEYVQEAAVIVFEKQGDKFLVACGVFNENWEKGALMDHLSATLPEYMIPSQFIALASIPKTANGKVDRKQLSNLEVTVTREYVAPSSEVEQLVVDLCAEVLGTEADEISMTDNFFDIGGHSLRATVLLKKIDRQLNINLPLVSLFKSPTLADLVRKIIERVGRANHQQLITLKEQEQAAPNLYLIHDGTGGVGGYAEFAADLTQFNAYALNYETHIDLSPVNVSIQELANKYTQILLAHQPQGPYVLGGWSLGGAIAYELAHQLEEAGHEVSRLLLMDTRFPTAKETLQFMLSSERQLLHKLFPDTALILKQASNLNDLWAQFAAALEINEVTLKTVKQMIPDYVLESMESITEAGFEETIRYVNTNRSLEQSLRNYTPEHCLEAVITYFVPEDSDKETIESMAATFSDQVEVHGISGDHYSMMKAPHVDQVVNQLNKIQD